MRSRGAGGPLPAEADPSSWAARLTVVRVFARHLAVLDERTEIPPKDLLPRRADRTTPPFLYSSEQIAALVGAAGGHAGLPAAGRVPPVSLYCLLPGHSWR
ncbi:hypothetical protein AB0B45_47435 [Nonomuraea sp. NPDC049152]|uniref:hypothetical protein n=1 Tax=Nonomuraea sp. NPDC049152 TaxID=3154350 RepID=UPI00340593F7